MIQGLVNPIRHISACLSIHNTFMLEKLFLISIEIFTTIVAFQNGGIFFFVYKANIMENKTEKKKKEID